MQRALMDDPAAQQAYGFSAGEQFTRRFGRLSIEGILLYVFAVCAHIVERLTDTHLQQVEERLRQLKPHTHSWYKAKALAFRYGQQLPDGSDTYPDDGLTQADIADMQVVHQCAVTDAAGGMGLIMKLACEREGQLQPLEREHLGAFENYIRRVKDAGIPLTVLSQAADRLRLQLRIYIDGAVMDGAGRHLIDGNFPVEDALRRYVRNLPFNGELILASLIDALQAVPGVLVPHLDRADTAHLSSGQQGSDNTEGYTTLEPIDVRHLPESGYYALDFSGDTYWSSHLTYIIQ